MQSTKLQLIGGWCLILGGLFVFFWGLSHVISAILIAAGMILFHRNQSARAGYFGLLALSITLFGCLLEAATEALYWLSMAGVRISPGFSMVPALVFMLGILLYGLATLLARVYSVSAGICLIAGVLLTPFLGPWAARIMALALIWLGALLVYETFTFKEIGVRQRPIATGRR